MSLLTCYECDMAPYLSTPCQVRSQEDLLPLLSLDQVPEKVSPVKKFSVPNSTVVLSRVCVNYLSSKATFSDWSICRQHKLQLLDCWVPPSQCCHHQHVFTEADGDPEVTMGSVTYAMSKTILKSDSMVLPIGGSVCKPCKDKYIKQYIPGLTSIVNIKTNNNSQPPPPPPPVLSPEEIQRRISSLTPVPPSLPASVSPPPTNLIKLPNESQENVEESRVDENVDARSNSPGSEASITIKDERIEAGEEIEEVEGFSIISGEAAPDDGPADMPPEEAGDKEGEKEQEQEKEQEEEEQTKDEGPDEFKFYCKLCHIGFLKETSYKYHLANNIELHKKAKTQKNTVKKCEDCGKTFKNDILFRKHLYNKHKVDDPHFCKLCNIVLKSESAYKSHYSKLHLERRTKIFYCRECGDIFHCRLEHQEHIKIHWQEMKDSDGNQCGTCGKVFGSGNKSAYVKHLATHDDDSQNPCDCPACESPEPKGKKRKRAQQKVSPKKVKENHSDLLSRVSKAFDETLEKLENDVDDPEEMNIEEVSGPTNEPDEATSAEDINLNVNCGVCGKTFDDIDSLESHIESSHTKAKAEKQSSVRVSTFVAKEGGWKCNLCNLVLRTSRALKAHKSKRECSVLQESEKLTGQTVEKENNSETQAAPPPAPVSTPPSVSSSARSYSNAGWQQSESRNWAAEFGYNKNSEDEDEEVEGEENRSSGVQSSSVKQSFKPKDILSAMKLNFASNLADTTSDDEEEEEGDLFAAGKDGRTVSMMNREPRLLSEASRQTRRRLEVLTKQAQEVMAEREKARDEKNKLRRDENKEGEKSRNNNKENLVEVSSEDEGDKNLLIPLANGWVCEQTKDVTQFWSPEGLSFQSVNQIEKYAEKHKLSLDISVFKQAVATVNMTGKTTENNGLATVRIKDEETGLPMVIIFPGGRDCLTMDVSATA